MELAFDNAWDNDTAIDDRPTNPVLEPKQESYVGAMPREIDDLYDRRHKDLVSAWVELRDRAQAIDSWDVSIKFATEVLLDHRQGKVDPRRDACARRDVALTHEDRIGINRD